MNCPLCNGALPADLIGKPALTIAEAAGLCSISEQLARKLIANGTWPTEVRRFGTSLRIPRDALLAFIATGSAMGAPATSAA